MAELNGRDPRVDRAVGWGLTTMAAGAMAFLGTEVRGMRNDIDQLSQRMERAETHDKDVNASERLRSLEQRMDMLEAVIKDRDRK